ncbi:enoyl-CoA hydratase/isomerase family protein [Frondihabitans sp. VKM Ac-2883]|uniref:enoyl-CoA hydratase/isomerase family protein n=1 Tax=Frondihabitans sp. VKM Ac-2883 TaxID=2783823 RepID=UPI00188D9306|nr:enoyl-CoA hydratase/isomerase family protein [Frondihabitans sp. VKM Ac-2883]MBF4577527.1 enoyl-CoA hydratase/isomerase family protein [Frondihabitans sp. VKM Ac-2883]
MNFPTYSNLHVTIEAGVAAVVLDNPPVNVLGATLIRELHDLLGRLRDEASVHVIVFSSANDEFFLAHVDMGIFDQMGELTQIAESNPGLNVFQSVGELLRHQPQVTIVKLVGTARAGGAEFVAAADMTFAARETAGIGQPESLMGILPGGGGTQYLLERTGRNRALEVLLSGDLFDADTAAAYGWINRALPAAQLDTFVDDLAAHIAAVGADVIAQAKNLLPASDLTAQLLEENDAWAKLVGREITGKLVAGAVERGIQTVEVERDLEGLMRSIAADL